MHILFIPEAYRTRDPLAVGVKETGREEPVVMSEPLGRRVATAAKRPASKAMFSRTMNPVSRMAEKCHVMVFSVARPFESRHGLHSARIIVQNSTVLELHYG